ncbi:MAG: hypothetical protein KDB65_12160 [Calditrichaeota bacterium]|nr:hypothetical protein [Calditrichota bacterium]MCB9367567.1 hypothetical protein [Calditrichota bacterium]
MKLRNVSFTVWLQSHSKKDPEEKWLRELYPWPVLAQVDYDERQIGKPQVIEFDGAGYLITLESMKWQPTHGTYRYRLHVESDGLGWHARSYSDRFDLCATPDGLFVTLFHTSRQEPLERIARAFFARRWEDINPRLFENLAVSRFLAASIVAQIVEDLSWEIPLTHYPNARLSGTVAPMFANGNNLWLGYRFLSETAYAWARTAALMSQQVVALYFADTKYQYKVDLPQNARVLSVVEMDKNELGGRYHDYIRILLRGLELPNGVSNIDLLSSIVEGRIESPPISISEADVNESLAALKCPCFSKSELRYQLAAAVVLNAWIEAERLLGFVKRKKFYAFKQKVGTLARWASEFSPPGVQVWTEVIDKDHGAVVYIRIDNVDFSFHAIPSQDKWSNSKTPTPAWSGVRLKPIAPIVLKWARSMRDSNV